MAGPLEGLLVVDASWGMPSAISSLLLSDYGARVVKIERPGSGPDKDSMLRRAVDRGKWSVRADLDTEEGRDKASGLVAGADVFIESFGPGGAAAFGLGYDELHAKHPGLVYCSVSGYGQEGPWRDLPGYDSLIAARLGLMAEQRGHRDGPIFLGHPSIAYTTGFLATIGILSALRARRHNGTGQLVDTSLLDGLTSIMSMNWWWNEKDLSYLARDGSETGFGRNRIITDPFRCADGEYLMMHTGGAGGFKRTMDILGLGEGIKTIDGPEMGVPLDDHEYHAARHLAPEAFLTKPREEWLRLFQDADIAALPVLRPEETLYDEQVRYADLVVELPDAEHGSLRQIGPVTRFSKTPAAAPNRAPALGEHDDRAAEIVRAGAPHRAGNAVTSALEGVRVLDFSGFFATAYGARLMSDLGADVIKVEPLAGDQMRPMADLFEGAQRGKRNLAVDLRTTEGQEVVRRLVRTADVVMHNFRPGKADKLGLGYDELAALKPDLIYAYLPGFGSSGPRSHLKSFAPLVSGFAGLTYEGAGAGNPPVRRVLGNEDLYNGFAGAVAVLMALQHRVATGEGQYVENPQLHSSLFVVGEHSTDAEGKALPAHVLDSDQTGWSPLYRLYRTSDGWICLACVGEAAFDRLARALDLPDLVTRFPDVASRTGELADVLAERFAELTAERAKAMLDAGRVPAEIPLDYPYMPEFLWEEWALEAQRVFEHHHPEHGWVREAGLVVRLSDTPGLHKGPSPMLGQHTVEVLGELGYDADEVDKLLDGVCLAPTDTGA